MFPIVKSEIPKEIVEIIGEITTLTFPRQGCTSDVAILASKEKSFVLKRSKTEQFNAWLKRESEVLEILSQSTNFAPEIYYNLSIPDKSEYWLLMEYVPGVTLREALQASEDEKMRQELIYQFGNILRMVHLTPCPPELMTDKPWLDNMLEDAAYNLMHYEVDGSKELLQELQLNRPEEVKQALIHGDFTIDNVLVHEGRIVKVIDWSGGAFGDPRYDAALAIREKPHAFQTEEDKDIFFAGYGERILSTEEERYFADGIYEFF
jgi:aminoglycoside phosphotransferase (APT) family kinase protein